MKKKTLDNFIEASREKYNNMFDYSLSEYIASNKPITLICSNGHTFQTLPSTHLSKNSKGGCKECHFKNLKSILLKYTQESFIEACNKVHNNTYEYSKTIYKMIQDTIIITCKIHGDFSQKAASHLLNKNGCTKCGRIRTENAHKLLVRTESPLRFSKKDIQDKIIKFNKIHNNKYKYGNIYRENNILWLEIICPKHDSHITRFFNHEKGHGCPKCVSVRSNVQIQWLEYRKIRDGFIQHSDNIGEYTVPGTKLCVDGYNKNTNTIYEFQGDFWHGNPDIYNLDSINKKIGVSFRKLYDKTMNKINILQDKGYNVVYIWENNWRKGIKAVKKLQKMWLKSKQV